VPFSWTLFLLAVFHFSVWSLGVACDPAQGYFAAHTLSLKACSDRTPLAENQQALAAAHLQAEELTRTSQRAASRVLHETEAAHAHASSEQLARHTQEGAAASALVLLAFLTQISGASQLGSDKPAAAAFAAPVAVAV